MNQIHRISCPVNSIFPVFQLQGCPADWCFHATGPLHFSGMDMNKSRLAVSKAWARGVALLPPCFSESWQGEGWFEPCKQYQCPSNGRTARWKAPWSPPHGGSTEPGANGNEQWAGAKWEMNFCILVHMLPKQAPNLWFLEPLVFRSLVQLLIPLNTT